MVWYAIECHSWLLPPGEDETHTWFGKIFAQPSVFRCICRFW
jgi:hypothetical protein